MALTSNQDSKNNNGIKEILIWRLTSATIWSILFQIIVLLVFLLVVNINIVHPLEWISNAMHLMLSPQIIFYLVPLETVIFAQGIICSKEYIAGYPFLATRFNILRNVLSLRNVLMCTLHLLSGTITAWLYVSLLNVNYSSLIKDCSIVKGKCLVEANLMIIISGFWFGAYYFFRQHLFGLKNILFPVVEQSRFQQIKSSLGHFIMDSVMNALPSIVYFIAIYFFYGSYFRGFVLRYFYISHEDEPLNTFTGLLRPSIVLTLWFFASLFHFTMAMMELLFEVNLTRHHGFPITITDQSTLSLAEGICLKNLPIIQHLSCLDLFKLATNDKIRRSELFTLSQPGGHPYNWNGVITSSLCLIDDFTQALKEAYELIETSPESAVSQPSFKPVKLEKSMYEPMLRNPNLTLYEPTVYRLRNLRQNPIDTTYEDIEVKNDESFSTIFTKQYDRVVNAILKWPGINYMFGEIPDAKIKYILAQGQSVIWTAQGISLLASKSYVEDGYGIVQKDLPAIITSIVKLKQTVERINKSPLGSTKRMQSRKDQFHTQMQQALRSATKRSLYNICNTFGPVIYEFPLTKEVKTSIKTFLLQRE